MPVRLNAKDPGEFIRDHLQEVGGRDFVGAIYQAYKNHLRGAGARKLPCRTTFHTYVWLLKETGAITFGGAARRRFGRRGTIHQLSGIANAKLPWAGSATATPKPCSIL